MAGIVCKGAAVFCEEEREMELGLGVCVCFVCDEGEWVGFIGPSTLYIYFFVFV